MNESLWELIQAKAEMIAKLNRCISFYPAGEPESATMQRMVAVERDHLSALKYLYDASSKEKAETDMTDFSRDAVKEYKEKNKLIK